MLIVFLSLCLFKNEIIFLSLNVNTRTHFLSILQSQPSDGNVRFNSQLFHPMINGSANGVLHEWKWGLGVYVHTNNWNQDLSTFSEMQEFNFIYLNFNYADLISFVLTFPSNFHEDRPPLYSHLRQCSFIHCLLIARKLSSLCLLSRHNFIDHRSDINLN